MAQQWTREQVAARRARQDALFVIDNAVYDVTAFLDEHPGGHEVLLAAAGGDASEEFADVGHSLDARELMAKFRVGEVVEAERREVPRRAVSWEEAPPDAGAGFLSSWKFPLLLGLALTLLYSYWLA